MVAIININLVNNTTGTMDNNIILPMLPHYIVPVLKYIKL